MPDQWRHAVAAVAVHHSSHHIRGGITQLYWQWRHHWLHTYTGWFNKAGTHLCLPVIRITCINQLYLDFNPVNLFGSSLHEWKKPIMIWYYFIVWVHLTFSPPLAPVFLLFQTSLAVARTGPLLAGEETCNSRSRLCGVKRSFKAFFFCFVCFSNFGEFRNIELIKLTTVSTVLLNICQIKWLLKLMHKYNSRNYYYYLN